MGMGRVTLARSFFLAQNTDGHYLEFIERLIHIYRPYYKFIASLVF